MVTHKDKHFYAVAYGRTYPLIAQSWADTWNLVSGCPGNKYRGFSTFQEAKEYLNCNGCTTFHFYEGMSDGPKPPPRSRDYTVGNGRQTGIYTSYGTGAEPEVTRYSHACHKALSAAQAAAFVESCVKTNMHVRSMSNNSDSASEDVGSGDSDIDGDLAPQLERLGLDAL
ncbi:uncharacterized protein BCR38DRAFT_439164 [Pseudomassariella vexata]|uniref:Ribonuclease H1 N-terminal domain-containing protein n=1 Tax=Pseudomassariella vexata TaxID=1141098 RepID=A0A1Y2DTU0_9PEZI|nr:uncharacterized protein BCR38DRAFT_439164 [Pseudomassariella vexata]ORY62589.1 hypothetical protein BCR38DRAFT_439164 [Pseudomassariella vexata]